MHCTLHVDTTVDTPIDMVLKRVRALLDLNAVDEVVIDTTGAGWGSFVQLKGEYGALIRQRVVVG